MSRGGRVPSERVLALVAGLALAGWRASWVSRLGDGSQVEWFAVLEAPRGLMEQQVAFPGGDAEWLAAFAELGVQ